jgi:alpha-tubulin suppressor-like RCC1 family protein
MSIPDTSSHENGQVGSPFGTSKVPVQVALSAPQVGVAAGDWHTCSWDAKGVGSCWGKGETGELGTGKTMAYSKSPLVVALGEDVAGIAAGNGFTCAWRKSGWGLSCWGDGEWGKLGTWAGGYWNAYSPYPNTVAGSYTMVAAGTVHACGLCKDGSVACWGKAHGGQIGDGKAWPKVCSLQTACVGEPSTVVGSDL